MADGLGTLDFFLLEAGEYLERLDAATQAPAGAFPAGDELLRLARAFRGSAIMANQHGMARAAQGLESAARAIRDGKLAWDEATRGEVVRAVDDCKVLMRRLRQPDPGDTERAEQVGVRLDRLSGRASAALRAAQGPGLDAGGRAFVAREAATIGSVLQHVARALGADPGAHEPLHTIVPAMSALRGVALLNDLPPLGDILAAIESTVKEIAGVSGPVPRETPDVLEAAARALARTAREVVDTGRPSPDSEEARLFAARLLAGVRGAPAVPIETLYYDDRGPHVVQQGTPPSRAGLGRVEMVSLGEFLTAAAMELRRAVSPVQRDLRLFAIAANLRPMLGGGGGALAEGLARFAEAARQAVGTGMASVAIEDFARFAREAADALAAAQTGEEGALAARLEAAATGLGALQPSAAAPEAAVTLAAAAGAPAEAAAAPPTVPPPAAPARVEPAAAPAAAPVPAPPRPAPAAAPAAAPVLGEADLATSYLTFEQLIAERGLPLGTIDDLLAGGTAPPAGAPRASAPAAAAPAPRVPAAAPAGAEADIVPIENLLYRGDAALRRALELKPAILAAAGGADGAQLRDLLHEVFDLVELGLRGR